MTCLQRVRPGAAHGEDEEDGKLAGVAASDMATSKEETVNRWNEPPVGDMEEGLGGLASRRRCLHS